MFSIYIYSNLDIAVVTTMLTLFINGFRPFYVLNASTPFSKNSLENFFEFKFLQNLSTDEIKRLMGKEFVESSDSSSDLNILLQEISQYLLTYKATNVLSNSAEQNTTEIVSQEPHLNSLAPINACCYVKDYCNCYVNPDTKIPKRYYLINAFTLFIEQDSKNLPAFISDAAFFEEAFDVSNQALAGLSIPYKSGNFNHILSIQVKFCIGINILPLVYHFIPYDACHNNIFSAIASNFCESQNLLFDIFYFSCDTKDKYTALELVLMLGLAGPSWIKPVGNKDCTLIVRTVPLLDCIKKLYAPVYFMARRVFFVHEFIFYSELDALAAANWYNKRLKDTLNFKGYRVGFSGFLITKKKLHVRLFISNLKSRGFVDLGSVKL